MGKNNDKDRLSILEKVERGEISIEDAESVLNQVSEDSNPFVDEEIEEQIMKESGTANPEEERTMDMEGANIPTRRERTLAMAEKFQDWEPHMMVGPARPGDSPWQWPWESENWQWMWQNFDHPIYVDHSTDISDGSELYVVSYQGDLFIRGWDEPVLKVNGAVFDLRVSQEKKIIKIASSTGQLQIWVPKSIARVEATVKPGDIWLSGISADIEAYSQSGDLGCERINGNIRIRVNGGDARLMGVEGVIAAIVMNGNCEVRDVSSNDVDLKVAGGDIWLGLDSVKSGRFKCDNKDGDINLLINGELAGEIVAEATGGGRIAPVSLSWQKLLGRSESKLHGILRNGGASINLTTQSGRIYIQESWRNTFAGRPVPGE